MIVVDTNVLVHLLSGTGSAGERATALYADDPSWCAPALALSELRNVLVGMVRRGWIDRRDADAMHDDALDVLGSRVGAVRGTTVLETALALELTAYDAEFVALAEELDVPLVTRDRAILEAAPERAREL